MNTAQGSLTMIGLNTPTPQIFWNGMLVPGVVSVRVDCDADEQRVKLKILSNVASTLFAEMQMAGIIIKRV